MLSTFDDAATLQLRARRQLVIAAALSAATLSPLVVMAFMWSWGRDGGSSMSELAYFVGWGGSLGLMLAAAAVRSALRAAALSSGTVIGRSVVAGLAYPLCLFAPAGIWSFATHSGRESLALLFIGPVVLTLFGAFLSVPAATVFGAVFWTGIGLAEKQITRPAHDVIAHARGCAFTMLLAATCVALLLASAMEGGYCEALFHCVLPALGVVPPEGTDAAWTRFVVLPAPLIVSAIAFAAAGVSERLRIARTADAILRGTHPRWILGGDVDLDDAATHDVLPLRESDRGARRPLAVRLRDDGSPYRGGGPAVALIASP